MTGKLQRPAMAEVIPEGKSGEAAVEHYTIDDHAARLFNLRLMIKGQGIAVLSPGTYAKLMLGNELYMSDTDNEWRTNLRFMEAAQGNVLVAGLGLGFTLIPVAKKHEVRTIIVIEKSPDVVKLVWPALRKHLGKLASKITVVTADIYQWEPDTRQKWDTIYFDIWAEQGEGDLKDMARLHRRFARRLRRETPGHWMGSWRRDELQARARR